MAQIIPLHRSPLPRATPAPAAHARTLRPMEVVLLLPIILPLAVAILLLLLGWFVAWLSIVALLATSLVTLDLLQLALRRMQALRPLDRGAISFQGR
jgi:hypothetical protein